MRFHVILIISLISIISAAITKGTAKTSSVLVVNPEVSIEVGLMATNNNIDNSNSSSSKARYDNYRLYRLHLETDEHVSLFQELEESSDSYVFYGHARHIDQHLTIMVAAHKISEITDLLQRFNIKSNNLVDNIQEKIDAEELTIKDKNTTANEFDWNHYFHLSTINNWLDKLV